MGKITLIFAAFLVLTIAIGVVSADYGEEEMDEEFFEELEEVLAKFCSTVLTDDSEEALDNEIHSDEKHYDEYVDVDRRKKRDLSSHGFDAEVLATKDPGTLIGYGLGLACVGLQRAMAEAARDAEELNRRKRQVHETVRHFGFGKV